MRVGEFTKLAVMLFLPMFVVTQLDSSVTLIYRRRVCQKTLIFKEKLQPNSGLQKVIDGTVYFLVRSFSL